MCATGIDVTPDSKVSLLGDPESLGIAGENRRTGTTRGLGEVTEGCAEHLEVGRGLAGTPLMP